MLKRSLPLIAVAVTALAIRLVYYRELGGTVFARVVFLDAAYYLDWARRIAAGDWLGDSLPFFVEPGYAYLTALLLRLGGDVATLRLLQAIAGTLTAVLTALLAARLAAGRARSAGVVAGLIAASYLPLIYFEGFVLKTTLEVLVASAALLLAVILLRAERPRGIAFLALGASCGVALAIKSNFLLVLPLVIGLPLHAVARRHGPRAALAPTLLALAGLLPVPATLAWRNLAASGSLAVLPWSAGINFQIGNGPLADGVDPTQPFASAAPEDEGRSSLLEAERRAGRKLGPGESSGFWWRETWSSIAREPGTWLELMWRKFRLWWTRYEFTDNVSFYFVRERVDVLRWPLPGWWLAAPLGCAGLLAAATRAPRDAAWLLVGAYGFLQMAGVVLFHVAERYRLAAVPAFLALGVAALFDIGDGRRLPRLVAVSGILLGTLLTNLLAIPIAPAGQNLSSHHEMLGVAAWGEGRMAEAEEELEKALAGNPALPDIRFNLAQVRRLRGDRAGALALVEDALAREPGDARARMQLAEILLDSDRPAESAAEFARTAALGWQPAAAWRGAARALLRDHRPAEAMAALDRSLALRADDPDTLELGGDIAASEAASADGAAGRAADYYRRAMKLRPSTALARKLATLPQGPGALPSAPAP